MKKILCVLLLFSIVIQADYVHWLGDYDRALKEAHKEHKNLMVFLVKKNCPTCNNIIKKFFMQQDYIKHLNKKFISVIVTYEGKTSYPIELFYSTQFPTLFFVNTQTESFLTKPIFADEIDKISIKEAIK